MVAHHAAIHPETHELGEGGGVSREPVEVEVEDLGQLEQAMAAGASRVLLDNFDLALMRQAVRLAGGRVELEASGGISLDQVRAIAETGVDFISVGAITKDISAVDLSMRFEPEPETAA